MGLKKKPNGTSKAEKYTIWKENLTRSAKPKSRLCWKKNKVNKLEVMTTEMIKTLAQREKAE